MRQGAIFAPPRVPLNFLEHCVTVFRAHCNLRPPLFACGSVAVFYHSVLGAMLLYKLNCPQSVIQSGFNPFLILV